MTMNTLSEYEHGSEISVLRACQYHDGANLIALGGKHSVEVIQVKDDICTLIASFYVGVRVTALAWSPKTISPSKADTWTIELAAAGEDLNLRLLNKYHDDESDHIFVFGGGLSGHRKLVNDLTWCGGYGEDNSRFLASVSDEKILLLWDLSLPNEDSSPIASPTTKGRPTQQIRWGSIADRPQPIPFAIPYSHPLRSIVAHPSISKELVVSDSQGSIFDVDWLYDPAEERPEDGYRGLSIAQLIDPRALADARTGMQTVWGGSVDWHPVDTNIIGAAYGSRWAIWDMRNLQGGKPIATGQAFEHGARRFRFCPSMPSLFGLIPSSPLEDAAVSICNISYPQSLPRRHVIRRRPHHITDFDWLSTPTNPTFVVSIGRKVLIIEIGPEVPEST